MIVKYHFHYNLKSNYTVKNSKIKKHSFKKDVFSSGFYNILE